MLHTRRARFSITITSPDLPLSRLSELMGRDPDSGWSKGDDYQHRGHERIYRFSRWSLVTEADGDANDWEHSVDTLMDRALQMSERFGRLPADMTPELMVDLTEPTGIFGFGLSGHHIAVLAKLRASLAMSIVVDGPGPADSGAASTPAAR